MHVVPWQCPSCGMWSDGPHFPHVQDPEYLPTSSEDEDDNSEDSGSGDSGDDSGDDDHQDPKPMGMSTWFSHKFYSLFLKFTRSGHLGILIRFS